MQKALGSELSEGQKAGWETPQPRRGQLSPTQKCVSEGEAKSPESKAESQREQSAEGSLPLR